MSFYDPRSGWFIEDIELPEAPLKIERSVTKSSKTDVLSTLFPDVYNSASTAFEYTMSGYIYPEYYTSRINDLAKSADSNVVILQIPLKQDIFAYEGGGKFAIKSLKLNRGGPLFTKFLDHTVSAWGYTITFTELPSEGEYQEGIDGFTESSEDSLGLGNLEELNSVYGPQVEQAFAGTLEYFKSLYSEYIARIGI